MKSAGTTSHSASATGIKSVRETFRRATVGVVAACLAWLGTSITCFAGATSQASHDADCAKRCEARAHAQLDPTHEPTHEPRARALRAVDHDHDQARQWQVRLTDADMDAREAAFAEFVFAARRDASLVLALETWAGDSSKPELAWTARLAARELQQGPMGMQALRLAWIPTERATPLSPDCLNIAGAQEQACAPPAGSSTEDPLRCLMVPKAAPFGEARTMRLFAPRGFAVESPGIARPVQARTMQTFKLAVQPEGVTLTISEQRGSLVVRNVYASGSIASLLEEYPRLHETVPGITELAQQALGNGTFFQVRTQGGPAAGKGQLREWAGEPRDDMTLLGRVRVPTDILGVKCTPISAEQGDAQLLGPGVGLRIERRVPGTIAAELDLKRGDILVEINGVPLCNVDDITSALALSRGGDVVVKLLDGDGLERTLTWSPRGSE